MADQKPSITDELMKLADLKEKGVLTDEEFAAAKADLLRALKATAPPEPPAPVACKSCDGSGKCHECDGGGQVQTERKGSALRGYYWEYGDCPRCRGAKACRTCGGRGTV